MIAINGIGGKLKSEYSQSDNFKRLSVLDKIPGFIFKICVA